jgi:hypothetical protein
MTNRRVFARLATLAAISLAAVGAAAPQLTDSWPSLVRAEDGDCRLEIVGNGKFMQIRASGLEPRGAVRFQLANAAMKPIDWQVRADGQGNWSQLYIPYLWSNGDGTVRNQPAGGTVAARLTTDTCAMAVSAPWRSGIRVIR